VDEPLPTWFAWIIIVPAVAVLIGSFVITRRLDRRWRARRLQAAARKLSASLGGTLDDRQAELLDHGILPWYEFPNLWSGPNPAERPPADQEANRPEDAPDLGRTVTGNEDYHNSLERIKPYHDD